MKTSHFASGRYTDDKRASIDTETNHPGYVFLHMQAHGFGLCEMYTPEQARALAAGYLAAAERAESDLQKIAA